MCIHVFIYIYIYIYIYIVPQRQHLHVVGGQAEGGHEGPISRNMGRHDITGRCSIIGV